MAKSRPVTKKQNISTLDLSKEDFLKALKIMMLARFTDEKHLTLVKQGKSFFHIGGSGHEGSQVAIAMNLISGHDWAWTYYRDIAFSYGLGLKTDEYFLLAMGKAEDPATGGRQMPGHFGHKDLNMPTQSSPTGTQFLNAVGTALANRKLDSDAITYVASGEGTTSQGEFYEAVNWASREKLAVLFHIQDNGYAISVKRESQSMGANVTTSFSSYENLKMFSYDGSDFIESFLAAMEAVEYMRAGKGPVLMHAKVERLIAHSSSDDQKKYRDAKELEEAFSKKDPIKNLSEYLVSNNIVTQEEIDNLWADVKKQIHASADWAATRPAPDPKDSTLHNFAPKETLDLPYAEFDILPSESKVVMVDAINHALHEELRFNDKIVVYGEDVADPKGGVFTATKGLSNTFGTDRVFNSPLAEASIIGTALGMAVSGFKPVVEIQFGDYIWPAFMQIRDELATMRFRSNGNFTSPVVIRVAVGGYIHGGLYHSQNIEAFFAHIPGMMIAYPSTAADAKGLLKTACRIQDPVLFLEHKGLYRLPYSTTAEPDENYLVPFGKGKIVREGTDATVVSWGLTVKDTLNAVKKIEKDYGKLVEVIDLRTISPWDKEIVINSVKKTNRLMIAHEDTLTLGFGAEIAAVISLEAFSYLDAPIMRHAAKDSHIPFAPEYENDVLPSEEKIYADIVKLLNY
ncbi:MAG: tungsten formylmethanofuran dehydrogenase [Ignavibacteria bacterium GWF2_33_9]|nr:MAG: tungsten formylmethanofuran dehydrogenase [Ignavibacteria bacterium GWF2_33_9]